MDMYSLILTLRLSLQHQRGPGWLHHNPGIHLILYPDICIVQLYLIQCYPEQI